MSGRKDSFPRQHARTRSFSLGLPRDFRPAPDGSRVAFLRSRSAEDPATCLWVLDLASGHEWLVADPDALAEGVEAETPEERARRERARERAGGIVAYATDRAVTKAAFALAGRLHVADLAHGTVRHVPLDLPVVDPRLDPTGVRVAYVADRGLHVAEVDGGRGRLLAREPDETVTWGLAEFVAAEEMGRTRGFWWSPDGTLLAAARVDTAPVARWHVADPASPEVPPQVLAYPAAGTANAGVSLALVDLDGHQAPVAWDADAFPYLLDVVWGEHGPLTVVLQSRDQRAVRLLAVDPASGRSEVLEELHDDDWVEPVGGTPQWLPDGRLLVCVDDREADPPTRRLVADRVALTPPGLQVRRVVSVTRDRVTFTASEDPTEVHVWQLRLGAADEGADGYGADRGARGRGADGEPVRVSGEPGVHDAAVAGPTLVLQSRSLAWSGARTVVHAAAGDSSVTAAQIEPLVTPHVQLCELGPRRLRAAVLLPSGYEERHGLLPVLLDPYGGPHGQRVLQRRDAFLVSQWFADAGFAVLVVDGRGTPGRGPVWERAVAGDLASAPLADQVEALHAAAERFPLDLARVAIRGWSFGGYLAALAVLRRPDVFAAAVAGAPVTEWRLYDTHYTERYLGLPQEHPKRYDASSLLGDAAGLRRPLLLIHGLADDNVVAAHTLRLSQRLLEAGRPHTVLPLSGVTHMASQEQVAENLLQLQLEFLRRALRLEDVTSQPAATEHAETGDG